MNPLYIIGGIAIMASMTYVIRVTPMVVFRKKIENNRIKSFLYYIPYAVLTAMTLPAIFYATRSIASAAIGLIVALIFAYKEKSLTTVAIAACLAVFLSELIIL